MSDVLQRIRSANPIVDPDDVDVAEFEAALGAIEDRWKLGDEPPRLPAARRPGWMRPALVAAGAALLVIIAIAAPILLLRSEEQPVTDTTIPVVTTTTQNVTTTLPITTTAPSPTTVPAPAPIAPAMTWTRVADDPMFDSASVSAVAAGGPGIMAAGNSHGDASMRMNGIVWISSDSVTWERIDDPSFASETEAEFYNGAGIRDIAAGPLGVVAVGFDGLEAVVWISPDGIDWSRVRDDDLRGEGLSDALAVTAGGPGWVAVGDIDLDGGIWVSEDGLDWIRVNDDDLLAGDRVEVTVYDVATWNSGLIAVGLVGSLGRSDSVLTTRGAMWVSEDGIEWTELVDDSFRSTRVFEGVSVDPSTGTAFAFSTPGGIWKSDDGATWEIDQCEGSWVCPPPSSGTAWDGDRVVAGGPDMALSLWVSGDRGATWTRVDPDEPAFEGYNPGVDDVNRFGDRFVVVGSAGDYLEEVGAIWIGTWDE